VLRQVGGARVRGYAVAELRSRSFVRAPAGPGRPPRKRRALALDIVAAKPPPTIPPFASNEPRQPVVSDHWCRETRE